MPSLRSSIRKRLEAEEAEQDNPAKEAESNLVEQADNPDNPVEAAAQEAVQKKLDEQPEPIVEPRMPRYEEEDDDDNTDAVEELELKAAHASAQVQGHKFGSRGYADAIAAKLRQEKTHHGESAGLLALWHPSAASRRHGRPVERHQPERS